MVNLRTPLPINVVAFRKGDLANLFIICILKCSCVYKKFIPEDKVYLLSLLDDINEDKVLGPNRL